MDGRSLVGPANNPGAGAGREILFENTGGDAGIRSGDFVYIDRGTDIHELYDLKNDPYQLNNLILSPNPAHISTKNALIARLAQVRNCAGANCP
jgi:arylsulfatase A-like enzyme